MLLSPTKSTTGTWNMLRLDNVTLFAHTGLADKTGTKKLLRSLKHSASEANFRAVKIIAPKAALDIISGDCDEIETVECPVADRIGYSRFSIEELVNYIDTDYCVNVQEDSGIVNPDLWDDQFLEYDYIGAPWPNTDFASRIGNGGFSLRSRKFLEASAELTYQAEPRGPGSHCAPEDWFLCVLNYRHMIDRGIKFPSVRLAASFAVEHPMDIHPYDRDDVSTYDSFGFHADFNTGGMKKIHGD